ncbi:hypothetical protein AB0P21_21895 [Kribbella sp. NPDC056861]|uniref:spermidine synthase n=1 Tax=Kribbella sp. NPDC056861 TaxID=3154857 RepID=UPI0034418B91
MSELARAVSERGELLLRRRDDGAVELRVNGVFVMDDVETSSEELLASAALDLVPRPRRVLVGGLGLGYTVRALLADERVESVLVAEIEPAVVRWMKDGLVPSVLGDPRVHVTIGDVRDVVLGQEAGSLDGLLLDVDNGPDFLVYNDNSLIYQTDFLAECRRRLAAGGVLTVWSSSASAALESAIRGAFGACAVRPVPVRLQGRAETYYVYQGSVSQGSS